MEKLRDYERESKTKLFSKAGLEQNKIDPAVKNKAEATQYLSVQWDCTVYGFSMHN